MYDTCTKSISKEKKINVRKKLNCNIHTTCVFSFMLYKKKYYFVKMYLKIKLRHLAATALQLFKSSFNAFSCTIGVSFNFKNLN